MMENRIRKIALISSITATAVASRVILSPLLNIKPVGALCLFAGIIGGPIVGFLVGSLTMVMNIL
jgi:LytS/YehU family sensor histidine kinase